MTRKKNKYPNTEIYEGVRLAAWIVPMLKWARRHGWKGHVVSGYRSYDKQKQLYDAWLRRGKTGLPAAKPGTSKHEGAVFPRGAVDVDAESAPQLSKILKSGPYANALKWAGSKDPVHFSYPHNGKY